MAECFGCRYLKFFEVEQMTFCWWQCFQSSRYHPIVGKLGGPDMVCEPPKQVCNGEYYL